MEILNILKVSFYKGVHRELISFFKKQEIFKVFIVISIFDILKITTLSNIYEFFNTLTLNNQLQPTVVANAPSLNSSTFNVLVD